MPTYKDVSGGDPLKLLKPGYHYKKDDNSENWYYNGDLHREDGPALIQSFEVTKGTLEDLQRLAGNLGLTRDLVVGETLKIEQWYLHGKPISGEELKEVQECPLEELPLYLNTPYACIAKRRLEDAGV